jgi:hypothetical protein
LEFSFKSQDPLASQSLIFGTQLALTNLSHQEQATCRPNKPESETKLLNKKFNINQAMKLSGEWKVKENPMNIIEIIADSIMLMLESG